MAEPTRKNFPKNSKRPPLNFGKLCCNFFIIDIRGGIEGPQIKWKIFGRRIDDTLKKRNKQEEKKSRKEKEEKGKETRKARK